jgi:hypothetical protein
MEEHLARLGVVDRAATVEHRTLAAVRPADGELELPHRSLAGEQIHLLAPPLGIGEAIVHAETPELLQGGDAEDLQARGIGVEDLTTGIRDVDPFPQSLDELVKGLEVPQRTKASQRHEATLR